MDAPHKPSSAETDAARVTPKAGDDVTRVTPMMEQFIEIKAAIERIREMIQNVE